MKNKRAKRPKGLTCQRPDVDCPKLVCGHPLPCPRHTIVIAEDKLFDFLNAFAKQHNTPLESRHTIKP